MLNLHNKTQLEVSFNELHQFGSNVLYISPVNNDNLQILREVNYYLADHFFKENIFTNEKEMKRVNNWAPHVTVLKTSADRKNGSKLCIKKDDYLDCTNMFDDNNIVSVTVDQIDLLSMAEQSEDGYYKSYGTIYLH